MKIPPPIRNDEAIDAITKMYAEHCGIETKVTYDPETGNITALARKGDYSETMAGHVLDLTGFLMAFTDRIQSDEKPTA